MTRIVHRCADTRARLTVPVLPPQPPAGALGYWAQDAADRCARLPPRQREVLTLLSKGMRLREIAALLGIAVNTVREHRERMLAALDVTSGAEAAVIATKAGLV